MILRINSAPSSTVNQGKFAKAKKRAYANYISFLLFKNVFIFAVSFCFYGEQPPSSLGHPEIKFNRFTLR